MDLNLKCRALNQLEKKSVGGGTFRSSQTVLRLDTKSLTIGGENYLDFIKTKNTYFVNDDGRIKT